MTISKELKDKLWKKYDFVTFPDEDNVLCVSLNDKWGLIDYEGKEIIPCKYDDIGIFYDGIAKIMINSKLGFINNKGKEIIPCKYDYVYSFYYGINIVKLNDKWGLIDYQGKEIMPCKYDNISPFYKKISFSILNNIAGFIDVENPTIFNEFMNMILNIGSRKDTLYYQRYKDSYVLATGSFVGTLENFEGIVKFSYNENEKYYKDYMKVIEDLKNTL